MGKYIFEHGDYKLEYCEVAKKWIWNKIWNKNMNKYIKYGLMLVMKVGGKNKSRDYI